MNSNVFFYALFLVVAFGQISCKSDDADKATKASDSSFDFNLRVFSHDEGEQKLSSFGNSHLKLNDYVILYSGEELLPKWTLEQLKAYNLSGLKNTIVDVVCYDKDENKQSKTTAINKNYFRVSDTLPDQILLNDSNEADCEYVVTGYHQNGSKLSILKMVTVVMDVSNELRVFPSINSSRILISSSEFTKVLKQKDLLQTELLDLICKTSNGSISQDTILSADTPSLQKLSIPEDKLSDAIICRLRSKYHDDSYLSETFVFQSTDVTVMHTSFRTFYPRENNDLFYTFQVTNNSTTTYELKVSSERMNLSLEHYPGGITASVFKMKIDIGSSKPMFTANVFQLLPSESIEIYIKSKDADESQSLYTSNRVPDYINAFNDITLQISLGALAIKEVGDSPYYLPVEMSLSAPLRQEIERIKNSHPYNKYKKVRGN